MSFVAKLITYVFIAMSFSVAPSIAAQNQTTVVSQTPLWVERNQSVEFVLETDEVVQTIDVYISSNPLIGRSSLDSFQDGTLSIEFRRLASVTSSQTSGQVTITIAALSLQNSGAYVIEFRDGDHLLTSTLLSYIGKKSLKPLNTVLLWPITAPPTLSPTDESLIEDYWNQNSGLIEAVQGHPLNSKLSWIMDADVITSANSTTNEEWLSNVLSATQDADVYVGAYANSDVNALIKAGRMQLASAAMSSVLPISQALNRSNIPRAIFSDGFSPRTWSWIEDQGFYLSITSNKQYPSSTSIFTPSAIVENPFGKKSLVTDKRVSSLMSQAFQNATPQNIQLLQADLFITALEQPQSNRTIVMQPTLWNMSSGAKTPVLEIFTSKWLNPIGASEALRKPSTSERSLQNIQTSSLSDRQRTLINDLESYRKRLAPFIADSIHNTQTIHAGLRVASVFDKNRDNVIDSTKVFFDDLLGAVSIVSSGSVVFARESGVIPITIRNNLSVPVYVNLLAQGFPEVRVELGNIDFVEIGAGQRKSIEIPATLYGSESAFVNLQLVDALGKKIGEPKRIEIASSAYATIAGIFVSIAFGLLFLLLIYNTQKRIRASRAAALENSPRE